MTIESIDDHKAFACNCGSVHFNLLKSGKAECSGCGEKDHFVYDRPEKLKLVELENIKLRSMCKAAAAEIDSQYAAHCDSDGYGPVNLLDALEGKTKPQLYPGFNDKI